MLQRVRWVAGLVVAGAVTAFPTFLMAQRAPVQFGVEGGLSIANAVGPDADGAKSRTTGFGGVTVIAQRPGAALGFQTGLQLIGKGSKAEDFGVSGSIRLRYLEAPILLRYVPYRSASGIEAAFTAGGTIGVRVGCSLEGRIAGTSVSANCSDDDIDVVDIRRVDAGVSIGADVAIPAGPRVLIAPMVRYTRGVLRVSEASTNNRVYNSVVQLGVGLRFRR
jgi:hypothetical protein